MIIVYIFMCQAAVTELTVTGRLAPTSALSMMTMMMMCLQSLLLEVKVNQSPRETDKSQLLQGLNSV